MSKISNTIGTVNYLQNKAKENRHQSKRQLYDDGYDVQDIDPATINRMDIDTSVRGQSRRASTVLGGLPANAQIVLSNAMAKLRNTLLHYPLVSIIWQNKHNTQNVSKWSSNLFQFNLIWFYVFERKLLKHSHTITLLLIY